MNTHRSPNARQAARLQFTEAGNVIVIPGDLGPADRRHIQDQLQLQHNAGRILVAQLEEQEAMVNHLGEKYADAMTSLADANRKVDQAIADRDAIIAAKAEQPRTITLNYIPFQPEHQDGRDRGGYWTVGENGAYQNQLDSREALALVAAMLLCAPFPRFSTIVEHENTARAAGERLHPDTVALDRIHRVLDSTEWDSDTSSTVAEILESTGRHVRDPDETE